MAADSPNISPTAHTEDGYRGDDWPLMIDGTEWNGKDLLELIRDDRSPFGNIWDVRILLEEVETQVQAQVFDIPQVHAGANNYGFHLRLSDHRDVMARVARADVNMPNYDGFALTWLHNQVEFEAAVYHLLEGTAEIPTPRLLYFRHPKQSEEPKTEMPRDISGQQLMLFDMSKDDAPSWGELNEGQKRSLLTQAARSCAALLNKPLPTTFVATWLFWTSFQPVEWMPKVFPLPPAGNRDFCIAMLKAKVEGLIGKQGDRIGWEEDKLTVGPLASAARRSLLRLIPLILPEGDDEVLYRLVLQHDDFGLHNVSVDVDEAGELSLTSVYDWETGCIIPVILTEIEFSIAGCDLIVDEKGELSVHLRPDQEREPERRSNNQRYSAEFLDVIYECAPYLKRVLYAGKDARRLWSALKRWKGDSPEEFFGELGSWAEARMGEMGAQNPSAQQPDVTGSQMMPRIKRDVSSL